MIRTTKTLTIFWGSRNTLLSPSIWRIASSIFIGLQTVIRISSHPYVVAICYLVIGLQTVIRISSHPHVVAICYLVESLQRGWLTYTDGYRATAMYCIHCVSAITIRINESKFQKNIRYMLLPWMMSLFS